MVVNYQNGKIYKIVSSQTDKIYFGSTTVGLSNRMSKHRYNAKQNHNISSKEILQYNDARIVLVENYPCNNREELVSREQHYIEQHQNNCCNNRFANGLNHVRRNAYNVAFRRPINCNNCDKQILAQNLARHKKSKYCRNY